MMQTAWARINGILLEAKIKGTPRIVAIAVKVNLSTITIGRRDDRISVELCCAPTSSKCIDMMNIKVPYICVVIVEEKLTIAM